MTRWLEYFFLLTGTTLFILGAMVAVRKVRRDQRERMGKEQRSSLAATLLHADVAKLERTLRNIRSGDDESYLSVSLNEIADAIPAERWSVLHEAAQSSGLLAHLTHRSQSPKPTVRGRALLALHAFRLPDSPNRFAPFLADPDGDVRLVACAAVVGTQSPEAVDVLLSVVPFGRFAPERVIERVGESWAVDRLITRLQQAPEFNSPLSVILTAIRALGLAGDPRAESPLIALLKHEDPEVRLSSARALGSLGTTRSVEALLPVLEDQEWQVRAQVASALGRLGAPEAAGPLASHLDDFNWWVRRNAGRALSSIGEPGIERLKEALHHRDRYARDRAREELAIAGVAGVNG